MSFMGTCKCGCGRLVKGLWLRGHWNRERNRTTLQRFFDGLGAMFNCWIWESALDKDGYGVFTNELGKAVRAHQWSYKFFRGSVPEGLELDHWCRIPRCVNPSHLEAVKGHVNIMRGMGFSALNAKKTHCLRGHELTGANLYFHKGHRLCRACQSERCRAYESRKRANMTHGG